MPKKTKPVDDNPEEKASAGKNKKRRIIKKILRIILLVAAVAGIAVLLFLFVFRVNKISVSGDAMYSNTEVAQASGIMSGYSIFLTDYEKAADNIESVLPYTTNVRVTRKLPSTVVIKWEAAREAFAVEYSAGLYVLTDNNLKILSTAAEIPENITIIEAGPLSSPVEPGKKLEFGSENDISELLKAVAGSEDGAEETGRINYINAGDKDNIYIIYDGRIIIRLGSADDIREKINIAKKAISEENKLSSSQYGEMNVSKVKKAVFSPKDYKNMPDLIAFIEGDNAEEETAEEESADGETDDESSDEESDGESGEESDEEDYSDEQEYEEEETENTEEQ